MELVAAVSSYQLGEYTGMALLLVGIVYCALRALWILPRQPTTSAPIPAQVQPAPGLTSSSAPPGFSPTPSISHTPGGFTAQANVRRAPVRWGYVVTAVVLAVALAFSAVRTSHSGSAGPWETGAGAEAKAGFISGCSQTGAGATFCGCLFNQLTAQPEYSTLSGFESLLTNLREYLATRNPAFLPHNYQAIGTACRSVA